MPDRILKTLGALITKTGERTVTALVSTPRPDRDRDTIDPRGIELRAFKANPVIPWSHDYRQPPVGRATAVRATADGLLMDIEFTPPELNEAGARIGSMYKAGYLNAFSIGFMPLEWSENEFGGRHYTRLELLEVSAVAVPANADALVVARTFGREPGTPAAGRGGDEVVFELAEETVEVEADALAWLRQLRERAGGGEPRYSVDPVELERLLAPKIIEAITRGMMQASGRLD